MPEMGKLLGSYHETMLSLSAAQVEEGFAIDTISRKFGNKLGLGTGATAGTLNNVRRAYNVESPVDLSFIETMGTPKRASSSAALPRLSLDQALEAAPRSAPATPQQANLGAASNRTMSRSSSTPAFQMHTAGTDFPNLPALQMTPSRRNRCKDPAATLPNSWWRNFKSNAFVADGH
eukprot:TRINITY_DN63635_c0_g1_i1.p1 TRINITY_DN63635_c0_g1~~TRINITY_DN63635_c0_g1_i1.p1  ORF type:complete len:177 (+),score=29.96 TRINITY_DN63635_c0_g1_i1:79-609(+)